MSDSTSDQIITDYGYSDVKIIHKLIKDNDKASDEEKKHQMDGVREVIAYCQNEVDCRRMQVLQYFGQKFNPSECKGKCNNCKDTREVQTEDLTKAAVEVLKMV